MFLVGVLTMPNHAMKNFPLHSSARVRLGDAQHALIGLHEQHVYLRVHQVESTFGADRGRLGEGSFISSLSVFSSRRNVDNWPEMQPHRCTQGVQEKKCNISTKQFNNMYGMRYYELSTCTSAV